MIMSPGRIGWCAPGARQPVRGARPGRPMHGNGRALQAAGRGLSEHKLRRCTQHHQPASACVLTNCAQ
jgi:hypothetical protein